MEYKLKISYKNIAGDKEIKSPTRTLYKTSDYIEPTDNNIEKFIRSKVVLSPKLILTDKKYRLHKVDVIRCTGPISFLPYTSATPFDYEITLLYKDEPIPIRDFNNPATRLDLTTATIYSSYRNNPEYKDQSNEALILKSIIEAKLLLKYTTIYESEE